MDAEYPPTPEAQRQEHQRKSPWLSRKWWLALITVMVMLGNAAFGWELNYTEVAAILLPVIAYIFGEAWVDTYRRN